MAKKLPAGELPTKNQLEALLFSSGRAMTEEQLTNLTGLSTLAIRNALHALQKEYEERDGAIAIFNDAAGWRMIVRERFVPLVKNIVADTELTRACMETLAVIAYKYPKVLQSEVIDIRGSGAYEHMAELERLGFIRRDPEGRSYAVKLTEKFFSYFDVAGGKDIRDVFKNVKVPKRVAQDAQKTLGDLQVVEVPKEKKERGKLEGMQIVDVSPAPERPPEPAAAPAEGEEEQEETPAEEQQPQEDSSAFLDDLDKRIARLTERNDELDKDETLKRRPLPGAESAQEDRERPQDDEQKQ